MARLPHTPLLLSLTAVLAAGALPARAQRPEPTRRVLRAESGDSTERQFHWLARKADSLTRIYYNESELSVAERRRVGEELDMTVAQIESLAMRMAESGAGAPRVATGLRVRVAPMVSERAVTTIRRSLAPTQARGESAMPRGWLGIVVSGTAREPRIVNNELIIRYINHPEIVSVEPSSPAERAGLIPSDTLIAYDGRDVKDRDISLTRLLRPNSRVMVRIRREGRTRDVPVTIADVPARFSLRRDMIIDDRIGPAIVGTGGAAAGGFPTPPAFPAAPAAPAPGMSRATVRVPSTGATAAVPPQAPTPGMVFAFTPNVIAGAQMATLTEKLGRPFGTTQGVLVVTSPVGSLASESGLEDGDVIVRVAGVRVRTVQEVREHLGEAWSNGEKALELEVLRDRRSRKVTLRW